MDPDALLAEIRAEILIGNYRTAAELFQQLDKWLNRGGFPPREWLPTPRHSNTGRHVDPQF